MPYTLLTRRPSMLLSELQEDLRSRRGLPAMVIPLAKVATPSWGLLEAPNMLNILKIGRYTLAPERRYQYLLENDYSGVLMPCREQA